MPSGLGPNPEPGMGCQAWRPVEGFTTRWLAAACDATEYLESHGPSNDECWYHQ